MSKQTNGYAQINRLYGVMVNILNSPKTIDVMRKMPAYVKGGEVFSFNNESFGATDKPDGDIFKGIERVQKTQAVTAALKRDYTAALKAWLDGEEVEADENGSTAPSKKGRKDEPAAEKPKKGKKGKKPVADDGAEPVETAEDFDLMGSIKKLLKKDKVKKAKKLLAEHEEHDDYEKAYAKIEKA